MKKKRILIFAILTLICLIFVACAEDTPNQSQPTPEPTPLETEETNQPEDPPAPIQEASYTIEQIQAALEGRIFGEIIAAQRVERDRDSITMGEVGQQITYDLSQATRYRVTYEVRIFHDELYAISIDSITGEEHLVRQWHGDTYRFEGDYIIFTHTEYYYFNDENGTPISTAWHC